MSCVSVYSIEYVVLAIFSVRLYEHFVSVLFFINKKLAMLTWRFDDSFNNQWVKIINAKYPQRQNNFFLFQEQLLKWINFHSISINYEDEKLWIYSIYSSRVKTGLTIFKYFSHHQCWKSICFIFLKKYLSVLENVRWSQTIKSENKIGWIFCSIELWTRPRYRAERVQQSIVKIIVFIQNHWLQNKR